MKIQQPSLQTSEQRFDRYLALLSAAVDHADRAEPLRDYCAGLLLPGERKSIEPIAARLAPHKVRSKHQSLHHFIAEAPWRDRPLLTAVRHYALPALLAHGRVQTWILDDTGLPKKGRHSVGVTRQYCGELGKTDNCQVAVSLSLANEWSSLPVAFDLYLPEEWAKDPERRLAAGVPPEVEFRTKPEIALGQIQAALAAGVPRGVVTADVAFGNDTDFRAALTRLRLRYAVGIGPTTSVWPEGEGPLPPAPRGARGRPPTRLRRSARHQPVSVKRLALSLGAEKFRALSWREGTRGKMRSRFYGARVRPAHRDYWRQTPHAEEWLIVEWPEGASEPTKYWLATLPERTSLKKLVSCVKLRWRIERDYEELKDEIGLGHYEGRGWRGFHHHATMCIAAYAFLVAERGLFSPGGAGGAPRLKVPGVPRGYRPRGAAAASRAP